MSDEYGANSGFKGSLVNQSVKDSSASEEGNYPPPDDTTSSGGWRSGPESPQKDPAFSGLLDQSVSGSNVSRELDDAKQGVDTDTRRDVGAARGIVDNSYAESWDSRSEAEQRLRSLSQSRSRS